MQVFVVFDLSRPAEVEAAIRLHFPDDHLALRDGQWLVAARLMTSRDVCDRLGISEGENGNGIVVAMDGYWGRAPNNIWEWMGARKAAYNVG